MGDNWMASSPPVRPGESRNWRNSGLSCVAGSRLRTAFVSARVCQGDRAPVTPFGPEAVAVVDGNGAQIVAAEHGQGERRFDRQRRSFAWGAARAPVGRALSAPLRSRADAC